MKKYVLFSLLLKLCTKVSTLKFEEITNDIFLIDSGVIAAFGHFDSDEFTDVFILQQGGNKLQVLLGSENSQHFQTQINCTYESVITSVVPGDFNADSVMDILITLSEAQDINEVKILWGSNGTVNCKSSTQFRIKNQPIVVDFNGDMVPDIIGESTDDKRYVWFSSPEKIFRNQSLSHVNQQKFRNPHSSGLIDINNDLASDILITGENNIELWYNTGDGFVKNGTINYPSTNSSQRVSSPQQSSFVDFNLDGNLDHIMPVCYDRHCNSSAILIWNSNISQWQVLLDGMKYQNVTWGFKLSMESTFEMAALPVTLRSGDVDMDGYPDFITVLQSKSRSSDIKAVILKNVECQYYNNFTYNRCLVIEWDVPGLKDIPNIQIAAFFDIFEDGSLDILASSRTKGEWKLHALKNTEILDSCFMKVLILSGLCNNCKVGQALYGVNQPGPIVRYNMTKQDGQPLVSSSVQMSQTAFFPLQLPYSVFGLGQTPNFIDALTVAIPAKFINDVHKRDWLQIIPNSQIVVIPHPPNDETQWVKKLFVTPSHFVLLTCIALVGTCIFISILVALLHWKERKEDKKEKMQDAYRFHFDAM